MHKRKYIFSLLLVFIAIVIPAVAITASAVDSTWLTDGKGHYLAPDLPVSTAYYWIDQVNMTSRYTNESTWTNPGVGSNEEGVSVWKDTPVEFMGGTMGYLGRFSSFDLENRRSIFEPLYQDNIFIHGGANCTHSVRLYDILSSYPESFYCPSSLDDMRNGVYLKAYCVEISNVSDTLIGFPGNSPDADALMNVTVDGVKVRNSDVNYVPNTYYVVQKGSNRPSAAFPSSFYEELLVFGDRMYTGEAKPEIHSVTVNGVSVADGGTISTTDKNVIIRSTYDSDLYKTLKAHGCTIKELSAYYLNGNKINVAAITPVDNGDGTSTKTYSRTLNSGDELTVESWLEVKWPDGSKDVVDEYTVTAICVGVDFQSISPVPTSMELTNKYTDLGTMDLGSSATNITFSAFPKELPAATIADGWTTGRSISVTRDGVKIYNRTYASNEVFGWNLKDNIDEGGTYVITLRVYAQKGEQILEKTHKFRVYVKGSTIKTIALEGVGTPVIGKSPSTINTVKCNTDGVVVKKVIWNYWSSEMGGSWLVMDGKFEAGKRYAVEVVLQTADGYSFTANKSDMTVYINGQQAGKSVNYDSNKFSATLEFEAITTPEFTTQPVGGEVGYGGKLTVNWATSFIPCKIVVGEYNSNNQVVNQVEYSNTTTSVDLPANQYGYVVIAYYNDANAKYSSKITITETTPAFTIQPVGGEVAPGEKLNVNWSLNFTPVQTVLLKVVNHPVDGQVTTRENLGTATTANVGAGYEYCIVRAYYSDSRYVNSEKFYVTEKQKLAITTQPQDVTVASGAVAKVSFTASGEGLTYTWYFKNKGDASFRKTTSYTSNSYSCTMDAARDGRQIYCVVTDKNGATVQTNTVTLSMESTSAVTITAQPKSVTVANGSVAKVSFTASGEGLTYTWYFKNAGDASFRKTTSYTSNSYSCTMDEARDGRQVYCVVTDKNGSTAQTNTVALFMAKESTSTVAITAQPKSVEAAKGTVAKVSFTASGEGLTYTWYFKNKGATSFSKTTSFTSNSYSCTMDEARDGRQVYCVVTDKNGSTAQTDTVTLSMAKESTSTVAITAQPKSVEAAKGSVAKVSFTATGDGLTYTWYFKNKGASSFSKTTSFTSNSYSCTMDEARDGRQVYCVVTDKNGSTAQTNTVTLSMTKDSTSAVAITAQPKSTTVAKGSVAKVSFTASGEGLTYTWYFKNKGASSFSKTTSFTSNSYSCTMDEARDGRQVYCVVTDKNGSTAQTNTVTLSMTKESASAVAITAQPKSTTVAKGSVAKVSFTASGEGLTYTWYFKNKGASSFSKTTSFTSNSYSCTMDEARDGRQVYCVVTDKNGSTAQTNTVTLSMTKENTVKITVQPKSVAVEKGTVAKASFTATGDGLTYTWYFKNAGDASFRKTTSYTSNSYSCTMDEARDGRQIYCVVADKYGNTAQTDTVTLKMK